MKHVLPLSLIMVVLLSFSVGRTAVNADFIGTWKGSEQCEGVSAPVAIIVITADGPDQVFISGMYSIQGKIRGIVKDNTITIPRQEVIDPNFKNLKIEGSLTLSKSRNILAGVFVLMNNELRDHCTVSYKK